MTVFTTKSNVELLIKQCENLLHLARNSQVPVMSQGICYNLRELTQYSDLGYHEMYEILKYCFRKWEHFSGSCAYPIPHKRKYYADSSELDFMSGAQDAYAFEPKWEGYYFTKREELLIHVINVLKIELASKNSFNDNELNIMR